MSESRPGAPQRADITASWRRARLAGLAPDTPLTPASVSDVDRSSRLLRAAGPVLDRLTTQLADTTLCLVVADHESRIVDIRFTDNRVESTLERIQVVAGAQFTEEVSGTNAVATPYETRRGVLVNGAEHYLESLRPFSCYGKPIRCPVTRRVEGVLAIVGIMPTANPLFVPFVDGAVHDVEQRIVDGARTSDRHLLAAFHAATAQRPGAVVVVGDGVVLTNPSALELLEAADHALLHALSPDTPTGHSLIRDLTLSSGASVQAHFERIQGAGGTLIQLSPAQEKRSRGGAGIRSGTSTVGRDLRELAGICSTVLIAGEPGTGRTSAVAIIADEEQVVTIDAAAVASMGQREWARQLEIHVRNHTGVLAVEDVHLLPPTLAVRLAQLMPHTEARIILTCGPRDQLSAEVGSLAGNCVSVIDLPPLRHRREDLPAMVTAILEEIHPGRAPRVTASALAALAAHQWPGNLRELRTVLWHVAGTGVAGDITVAHLPDYLRSNPVSRALTPWEQAEYDAIVAALRATDGNKLRAARKLGISRSTLYNRIRSLRIAF